MSWSAPEKTNTFSVKSETEYKMLVTIPGAEYSKDGGTTWQDSPTFTDLTPNTEYSFVARIKATENSYASVSSTAVVTKTDKSMPATPVTPTAGGTPTSTSITLESLPGAEYSKDGGNTWQDYPTFTGLTPNTEYTFVTRTKATDNGYPSENSEVIVIRTDKSKPNAPAVPTVNGSPTSNSITLVEIDGAEYSIDGGNAWQDSSVFIGLTPNTEYTFIARIKATESNHSSDTSEVLPASSGSNILILLVVIVLVASLVLIIFLSVRKRGKVKG